MRRELKENRTDREIANEKMFGPWLKGLFFLRYILHAASFGFGVGYFYGAVTGQADVFGIDLSGNAFKGAVAVSVACGLALEWVHGSFPPLCYHLALNPKETLRDWDRRFLFLLSIAVVAGITLFSAKTSEGGGDQTGKKFYVAPTPTDMSGAELDYTSDSLRVASASEIQAKSIMAIYEGRADSVEARFGERIRKASKEVRLWSIRARTEGPQAKIEVRAWESKERAAKAEAKAARKKQINLGKAKAASIRLASASKLEDYATTLSSRKAEVSASDAKALAVSLDENEALRDFLSGAGFWVVIAILIIGFIDTFLAQSCGYKPPGFAFSYPKRFGRIKKSFVGIWGGIVDRKIKRFEETEKELNSRSFEASAYWLPSGLTLGMGIAVVGLAFFVIQTSVYSEADHMEASFVPAPWNWVGLIVCVIAIAFGVKQEVGNRRNPTPKAHTSPVVPTGAAIATNPLPTIVPTPNPAVIPHITVPHVSGIPTPPTASPSVATPTAPTLGPNKKATPVTVRKAKKPTVATAKEMVKADKRIRTRCRRAWQYKDEEKIEQSYSAYAAYLEDKIFMEANGVTVTELAEGRLSITTK